MQDQHTLNLGLASGEDMDAFWRRVATTCTQWLAEQGAPALEAAIPMLSQLLKAELAEREVRSIAYHMKSARFPAYKDLSGFDFAASEINEATVRTLHRCELVASVKCCKF